MGTQAVVSVVSNGETIAKAVAGCDGQNAPKLAEAIAEGRLVRARAIFDAARKVGFGCEQCLAVLDSVGVAYEGEEQLPQAYRATFDDPRWNPRWDSGLAEHVLVINRETFEVID